MDTLSIKSKAYRHGLCDGLLGRQSSSSYYTKNLRTKRDILNSWLNQISYTAGFIEGKNDRLRKNITFTVPNR